MPATPDAGPLVVTPTLKTSDSDNVTQTVNGQSRGHRSLVLSIQSSFRFCGKMMERQWIKPPAV